MFSTTIAAGSLLAKRVVEEPSKGKQLLDAIPGLVLLADFIVFFPILVIVSFSGSLRAPQKPAPD